MFKNYCVIDIKPVKNQVFGSFMSIKIQKDNVLKHLNKYLAFMPIYRMRSESNKWHVMTKWIPYSF